MGRLDDSVAIITGAASGIGRATALRFAAEGARLQCLDIEREGVEETAEAARKAGAEAIAGVCDISDPAQVAEAVGAAVAHFGRLDTLQNVAGIIRFEHTHDVELATWEKILAVNLTGTFLMCQSALPHLLETKGSITNVASTTALGGQPWAAAYAASKGGVLALTYTLAAEYGKLGLRVNAVCPGSIETGMTTQPMPEGADFKLLRRVMSLRGFAGPEKIASVLAMLASEDGSHIHGESIRVDGGALC